MVEFAKELYLDPEIIDLPEVKRKIENKVGAWDIFLVCIRLSGKFNIEIMCSKQVLKRVNLGEDYIIIGVAKNKKAAFLLIRDIMDEFVASFVEKDIDFSLLKKYMLERIYNE